jgi:carbon monoxide dehydrogenase subunit G
VKITMGGHFSCFFSEVRSRLLWSADAAVVLPIAEFGSEAVAEIKKAGVHL